MTGDLTPLFEGKEIRAVEQAGEVWFPLTDLTTAWGLHRNTLRDIIQRNEKKFAGFVSTGAHETCAGLTVVNEHGLYLLMGSVNTARLKNPVAAEAILRFQRWVPDLIKRYRKGELAQTGNVDFEIQQAKHIAELTGGDLRAFQAAALKKCGMPEYADALMQSVPALVHGEPGWLNPSQLGERCGLNAREINSWLYNHGFQYPEGPVWRLQPKGEEHGQEYWFEATSGHREIRIRWKESILTASGLIRQPEPVTGALVPARATG